MSENNISAIDALASIELIKNSRKYANSLPFTLKSQNLRQRSGSRRLGALPFTLGSQNLRQRLGSRRLGALPFILGSQNLRQRSGSRRLGALRKTASCEVLNGAGIRKRFTRQKVGARQSQEEQIPKISPNHDFSRFAPGRWRAAQLLPEGGSEADLSRRTKITESAKNIDTIDWKSIANDAYVSPNHSETQSNKKTGTLSVDILAQSHPLDFQQLVTVTHAMPHG